MPLPPAPVGGSGPQRGPGSWRIVGIAAAIFLGLAVLGVLLCRFEVLPFCVSCDKNLVVEYLGAGTGYRTTGAWPDAFREFDAGQTECANCSKKPVECSQIAPLWSEAKCHTDSQRLVAEAKTLLDGGEACPAIQKLEEVQKFGCEPKAAETLLVTGTEGQGGAYVSCSVSLLVQASQQNDPVSRKATCEQVYGYLANARKLKPADPTINQLFTRAERYATLQKELDAKNWTAAAGALQQLELVAEGGQYGGQNLKELWFAVYFGQGEAALRSGKSCEAWTAYQAAEAAAQTLKQKDDAGKGVKEAYALCSSGWTPTPTPSPTPTVTPTPTATPQPKASAKSDQANVRKCPYTSCVIAAKTKAGESMGVNCGAALSDGNWYEVKTAAGVTGWIRFDLVNLVGRPATCPIIPTPPPPPPPPPVACRPANSQPAVQPIAPPRDKDCNGQVRFAWQWSSSLQADEEYEIHIWPDRQQTSARVAGTRETAKVIDLGSVKWINWTDSNRAHYWEVVVICKADKRVISAKPLISMFYFRLNIPPGTCTQ